MINEFIEFSKKHERMLVGYLWKNPRIYEEISNHKIKKDSFTINNIGKLYRVGKSLFDKGIDNFDTITVESAISKTKRTKSMFEGAGGFDKIKEITKEIDDSMSYEYHLEQILKYSALRRLYNEGLINDNNKSLINALCTCSLKEAETLVTFKTDSSFENADFGNYEVTDVTPEEMIKAVEEAKIGIGMGMKIYKAPLLTRQIKGFARGRMIYLGLKSGEGKSTILRNLFLQTIIDNDEDVLVLINEESKKDWLLNLSIAMSNTRLARDENDGRDIYKDNVFSGNIEKNDEKLLRDAIDWYKDNFRGRVKLVTLKSYRFKDVSKIIRKYSKLGFGYVLFDTFKPDSSRKADTQRWEHFSEMSQQLYDLIKPENLNIGIVATVQLKISNKETYLTHDSIGKAKEIVEVADITALGRLFYKDEYPSSSSMDDDNNYGGKEIKVYKYKVNNRTKEEKVVQVTNMSIDKQYIIVYFGKNRAGSIQQQIVFEMDYDRNVVKEVGFCKLKPEI